MATGQGMLGNNMFVYCLNNPVICSDYSGTLCRVTACCYDGGGGGFPQYISSQTLPEYRNIKLGWSTIGHSGCGPVAVYNAMQMLGEFDTTLNDIIDYYEDNNALILGGLLGSLPGTAVTYLEEQGYTVFVSHDILKYSEFAKCADASILWYSFKTHYGGIGVHFFTFKDTGSMLSVYNLWSYQRGAIDYPGNIYDFCTSERAGFPLLILIFK